MKRYVSLEEISDGRLYTAKDMVRADCHGCEGCSACCHGMGESIILDPYDVYRLGKMEGFSFAESIGRTIELNVVDGVILPNLMMSGEKESCGFLDQEGRCSIHPYRPGICRLFPLGRFYEEGSFRYFLQKDECPKARTKIKLSKWLDTPELSRYEEFVLHWHYLVKDLEEKVSGGGVEESKKWNMSLLKLFYFSPYDSSQDFFAQYENRCQLFQENPVQAC
ncbi:MAG: YkgJ family cysteine cluster protein [Acetatifactor sp.]|nr:YkgJ family cysteine cluster protein [Acetatifactor sp.]